MGKHQKPAFRHATICSCGSHGFVGLTLGKVSLFSVEDMDAVSARTWGVLSGNGGPYARAKDGNSSILMHRAIMGLSSADKAVVDHRNHDCLDNRRDNLRVCEQSDNLKNKAARRERILPKGVYAAANGKFISQICANGNRLNLGTFATVDEAASAYVCAALQHHGQFAEIGEGRK